MNSPFMGQQLGNCKSFTLAHYLANLFAPFHSKWVNLPIPESNFNILPWKSKVNVMGEVRVESHNIGPTFYRLTSLCSMSIGHPIPEIRLFQNLTLKIQGQGHGRRERWKSQHGSNILLTHIPFVPCQSAIPFLGYDFFKIWPWKSKVKVMVEVKVESHKVGVTTYRLTTL